MTKQLQPPHYKAKEQRLRIPEESCWLPYSVCNMKDRLFFFSQQTLLCLCKKCGLAPLVTDGVLCRSVQFTHSVVSDSATPWTVACQASLSITNSWSLLKLMSIALVMPSNRLILCSPLLLLSIFPNISVFSSESVLCIRWPKYWSFSFSISPSNE